MVKHAVPLGPLELGPVVADTWHRGGADALILSGTGTGRPTDPARVEVVRREVPEARVWLGSGVTLESAPRWRTRVHGAIVGTALHRHGELELPVEEARVAEMAAALGI
jgi:predicted TIM-barrel enzyme